MNFGSKNVFLPFQINQLSVQKQMKFSQHKSLFTEGERMWNEDQVPLFHALFIYGKTVVCLVSKKKCIA